MKSLISYFKQRRFRNNFINTLYEFHGLLLSNINEKKVKKAQKNNQPIEPHYLTMIRAARITSKVQKIAGSRDGGELLANLLYSETILMRQVLQAKKDRLSIRNETIQESIEEIAIGFENTVDHYYELRTEGMREEIQISRELRAQRERMTSRKRIDHK
ncbi:hypothetical protein JMA_35340 [Jeotgalibacillus malaysiensis]|uniref:Uncharacterized protein n=1 Tax=Jeotgalibacillus malaysiensis TaxID=1508404 RepID=A0A0B5AS26_9BACL|nr:hypothetical protein [Jeotgalibacillus malaysiensis]AJD92851.1 hypothetical protein JMA_35340 [Jeotgalibacillus malaysiensis]